MQKILFAALLCLSVSLSSQAQTALTPKELRSCPQAAGMRDSVMEAEMVRLFKIARPSVTPLGARITSTDWNIFRDEMSGVIIRRGLWAAMPYSLKPGKCEYQMWLFTQEYDGEKYQTTLRALKPNGLYVMACGCMQQ